MAPAKRIILKRTPRGAPHRFYELNLEGPQLTISYGRAGHEGHQIEYTFDTAKGAQKEADRRMRTQVRKGYNRYAANGRRLRSEVDKNEEGSEDEDDEPDEKPAKKPKPVPKKAAATTTKKSAATTTKKSAATTTKKSTATTKTKKSAKPKPSKNRSAKVISPKSVELWRFAPPVPERNKGAFGIYIGKNCWYGNDAGFIYAIDQETHTVTHQFKVPTGVFCIISDGAWLYCGCDDGTVFDLTAGTPRRMYGDKGLNKIEWMEINDGLLAVSDHIGNCCLLNIEGEEIWKKTTSQTGLGGWTCRADAGFLYHSFSSNLMKYQFSDGTLVWEKNLNDDTINFGCQDHDNLFVGTVGGHVFQVDKATGKTVRKYPCNEVLLSCASTTMINTSISPALASGTGNAVASSSSNPPPPSSSSTSQKRLVFGGDWNGVIHAFDMDTGDEVWRMRLEMGAPNSMEYTNGKLYVVTRDYKMGCYDVSPEAIEKATSGVENKSMNVRIPDKNAIVTVAASTTTTIGASDESQSSQLVMDSTTVTTIAETSDEVKGKVVLECVKEGGKLRVRVASPTGFNRNFNVQFPREIREEGAKFVVDQVVEANRGGFYRTIGEIRRLISS